MKCEWCGAEYERKSNHQKFCSKKCQRASAWRRSKKAKTDSRKCPVCNKVFITYEESNQVCCSSMCYEEYHRNNMREYARRKQKPRRSRGCTRIDTCYYGAGGVCQYLLITGKSRDCDISECNKYRNFKQDGLPRVWGKTYGERIRLLSKMQTDGSKER